MESIIPARGEVYSYEDQNEYSKLIEEYFNLEYFNITNPKERQEFFN